jgi:hypothetical protein
MSVDTSGARKLAELASFAWELSRDAFAERFGPRFLIHHGPFAAEGTPAPVLPPMPRAMTRQTMTFDPGAVQRPAAPRPRADSQVFSLRSSGRSAFAGQIWVGRARNNDIVIPDTTVSETHAYFKEVDGRWTLFDARSRNGTFVDDIPVRAAGALEVSPGSRVRFGSVTLQFVGVDDLMDLVRRVATRPPTGTLGE